VSPAPQAAGARATALDILYVGPHAGTCLQRSAALVELGHRLRFLADDPPSGALRRLLLRLGNRCGRPPDLAGTNRAIREAVCARRYDLLWIDKGRTIGRATLARVRRASPQTLIVNYSPDDMSNPDNQSFQYRAALPAYDLLVTTKSYNVAELRACGAREVLFVDNAYDPRLHRPLELSAEERARFAADVGFVGWFERERAELMQRLAAAGIRVTVWGADWGRWRASYPDLVLREEYLDGLDYAKAINATRINLGFLRKVNRDLQTTRSVEIPACRAFLLAERTDEHRRLFREGQEAEFFSTFDELRDKCRHYLAHEDGRRRIAGRGYERCLRDGYSNAARLGHVLERIRELGARR